MGPVAYWFFTALFIAAVPPSLHLFLTVVRDLPWTVPTFAASLAGALAAASLCAFTRILQAVYIFFHELAHAAAVLLSSGTIHQIRFGIDLGWVKSDKDSFFIRMAPYFLPLFPLTVLLLYYPSALLLRREAPGALAPLSIALPFLFSMAWCTQWFYNAKLFVMETSDVDRDRIFLSVSTVVAAFFLSTSGLFLLAFSQAKILDALAI